MMNKKRLFLLLSFVSAYSLFAAPGTQITLTASLQEADKIYEKAITLHYAQDGTPIKATSHAPDTLSLITDSGYEAKLTITRVQPKMVTIQSNIQEHSRITWLFPVLAYIFPPIPIKTVTSMIANEKTAHIPIIPDHIDEDLHRLLSIKVIIGLKSKL